MQLQCAQAGNRVPAPTHTKSDDAINTARSIKMNTVTLTIEQKPDTIGQVLAASSAATMRHLHTAAPLPFHDHLAEGKAFCLVPCSPPV